MPAYALVELTVNNPDSMSNYMENVPATVAAHGGKYLIRGAPDVILEGSAGQHPLKVVLEFPSMDAAKGWYNSAEYQAIIGNRLENSEANFLLIEGV